MITNKNAAIFNEKINSLTPSHYDPVTKLPVFPTTKELITFSCAFEQTEDTADTGLEKREYSITARFLVPFSATEEKYKGWVKVSNKEKLHGEFRFYPSFSDRLNSSTFVGILLKGVFFVR